MAGSDQLIRARDMEGRFVADDLATPDVNEAWLKMAAKDEGQIR
jgi:hypothetical protein